LKLVEIYFYTLWQDFEAYYDVCQVYGPLNPHFGHLKYRPNLRHFWHLQITISPQLGQFSFVAFAPGGIVRLQLVQIGVCSILKRLPVSLMPFSFPNLSFYIERLLISATYN
jgi:hypothetical protein